MLKHDANTQNIISTQYLKKKSTLTQIFINILLNINLKPTIELSTSR